MIPNIVRFQGRWRAESVENEVPVRGGMTVRAYPVLHRAVVEGVAYGYRRAHEHADAPDVQAIEEQIVNAVMNEVCEYFDFSDQGVES